MPSLSLLCHWGGCCFASAGAAVSWGWWALPLGLGSPETLALLWEEGDNWEGGQGFAGADSILGIVRVLGSATADGAGRAVGASAAGGTGSVATAAQVRVAESHSQETKVWRVLLPLLLLGFLKLWAQLPWS